MKKFLAVLVLMAALSPVFGQEEYTLYYSGDIEGFVTIQKDRGGKITITPKVSIKEGKGLAAANIDNATCPLIPVGANSIHWAWKKGFTIDDFTTSIIIDGNTTMETESYGSSGSSWTKTVVDGNTTSKTSSSGFWSKMVVDGNTTMETNSYGSWTKTVVNGNTTIETRSNGSWTKTVVDGNTTMETDSYGRWTKTIVAGNTTTETWSDGNSHKRVVDKQGNNIFITEQFDGGWEGR